MSSQKRVLLGEKCGSKKERKEGKKIDFVDAKGRPRAQEKRAKPTLCLIKNYYIYNIFT